MKQLKQVQFGRQAVVVVVVWFNKRFNIVKSGCGSARRNQEEQATQSVVFMLPPTSEASASHIITRDIRDSSVGDFYRPVQKVSLLLSRQGYLFFLQAFATVWT